MNIKEMALKLLSTSLNCSSCDRQVPKGQKWYRCPNEPCCLGDVCLKCIQRHDKERIQCVGVRNEKKEEEARKFYQLLESLLLDGLGNQSVKGSEEIVKIRDECADLKRQLGEYERKFERIGENRKELESRVEELTKTQAKDRESVARLEATLRKILVFPEKNDSSSSSQKTEEVVESAMNTSASTELDYQSDEKSIDVQKTPPPSRPLKDPNAPKRSMSAFFFWLGENRSRIKKPGMSVTDVSVAVGQEWGKLKDKTFWEEMARKDKKRYELEMKAYRAPIKGNK